MKPARDVIISALRYDHDNTANADRIIEALQVEGYSIVTRGGSRTPETTAMFANYGQLERKGR